MHSPYRTRPFTTMDYGNNIMQNGQSYWKQNVTQHEVFEPKNNLIWVPTRF